MPKNLLDGLSKVFAPNAGIASAFVPTHTVLMMQHIKSKGHSGTKTEGIL